MKTSLRLLIAIMMIAATVPLIAWRSGSAQSNAPDRPSSQPQEPRHRGKFRRAAKPIREQYIVVLKRETPGEEVEPITNDLLARHGGSTRHIYTHAIKGFSIRLPEAAAMALSRDPRVEYVEEDVKGSLDKTDTTTNWHLDRIDQRNNTLSNSYYYPNVENGAGVHAYILDTGIRAAHRQFSNADGTGNRATADTDVVDWNPSNGVDCHGHGTAVAGLIGGRDFGAAKAVRLHGVRVVDCFGDTYASTVLEGVDWVTANHIKPAVVNMSLGFSLDEWGIDALEDGIRESIAAGITYVVAAGNSNLNASTKTPARIPEVITVGATNATDARSSFSNFGAGVDLFAPGENVLSANTFDTNGDGIFNDTTTPQNGTSFAAPLVAGVAARFLQVVPNAAPAAVLGAVVNSATNDVITDPGFGSPNKLLFGDLRHAFLGQMILPVSEGATSVDTGIDVGPGQWLAMSGFGEIWAGFLFTGNNGPQGWNTIENNTSFPLPGSRPFSLIGRLNGLNFYIGTSNATSQNFIAPQRLTLRTNDNVPGNGSGAFSSKSELWKVLPEARADFVGQWAPGVVAAGQTYPVTISMKNVGPTTWTAGQSFRLGTNGDSLTWGINRVTVPYDVPPGGIVHFDFNITAPSTPGIHNFQWRMLQEGVQRFGDMTPSVPITVVSPSNNAEFVSQTVTKSMEILDSYGVSVTMRNIGNTTWTAGALYRLGSQNLQDNMTWGMNRVPLPHSVPPGGTVTFDFIVTAPSKAGLYNFQWRMVQDNVEWFGAPTQNAVISVKKPCTWC